MSKELVLKKNSGKLTRVFLTSSQEIEEGTEEKKLLSVRLENRQMSLICRVIKSENSIPEYIGFDQTINSQTRAERYAQALAILQKRRLPVPQSVRIISENEVVVTDVIANGGSVYDIKAQSMSKMYYAKSKDYFEMTETDLRFSSLDLNQTADSANHIASQASSQAVLLAEDSPFHIVFNPNGQWKIMILDIATMKIGENVDVFNEYLQDSGTTLTTFNELIADRWVRSAVTLQKFLNSSIQ